MSRLEAVFRRNRPALIAYVPLGDPSFPYDLPAAYAEAGVDVLEIGVPGASPTRDGPTIAASLARASAAGIDGQAASAVVRGWREGHPDQAMVWMTYPANGSGALVDTLASSGVDGLLLPTSVRHVPVLAEQIERLGIDLIHFLPYDPTLRDIREAANKSRGYVMVQAAPGATGTRFDELPDSAWVLRTLRQLGVQTPIALGIGISSPGQARAAVRMGADGVVVGSATVEAGLQGRAALVEFLRSFREALDAS
jgi:tryptophan synthase alpha chain